MLLPVCSCEDIGQAIVSIMKNIERSIDEYAKLAFQQDPPAATLKKLQVEVYGLLKEHLNK